MHFLQRPWVKDFDTSAEEAMHYPLEDRRRLMYSQQRKRPVQVISGATSGVVAAVLRLCIYFQHSSKKNCFKGGFCTAMSILTRFLFRALVLCFSWSVGLLAQQTTATLSGTVTDSSGAAVAGVAIKATNLGTNQTREAVTDAAGTYSIPFLPAGDYKVCNRRGFSGQENGQVTCRWIRRRASTSRCRSAA